MTGDKRYVLYGMFAYPLHFVYIQSVVAVFKLDFSVLKHRMSWLNVEVGIEQKTAINMHPSWMCENRKMYQYFHRSICWQKDLVVFALA